MNIIRRLFCRSFQTVMKIAIPFLPYRDPSVLSSVNELPELLKEQKIDRVLIVTDETLNRLGMLDSMKAALDNGDIFYCVYDKTVPNPTTTNVEQARQLYIDNACQALIGFGGGSSIDCAKAVGARLACPRKPIAKMQGILKVRKAIPYLAAIPTTAGTGSEITLATVITDDESGHKFPISDFSLIPRAAVLDPELTRTLPPAMTATTGMDALTHAIEAYIGRSTTRRTRKAALEAVSLIADNLEKAYADGSDMVARANMLQASYLAGSAFSVSYVGYCHAVAHSLGGKYHVPHGLANAVLLPCVLEGYGSSIYKKGRDIAQAMHIVDKGTSAPEACRLLIDHIRGMNRRMDIPERIDAIQPEDIPQLARLADNEGNPVYPVPRLMNAKELEQLYRAVM